MILLKKLYLSLISYLKIENQYFKLKRLDLLLNRLICEHVLKVFVKVYVDVLRVKIVMVYKYC